MLFPLPSLTSSPLIPSTCLVEIGLRYSSSLSIVVLCAKLHISDLEWKDLLLDHGQRISHVDWLRSVLQLGTALGCSWGEAVAYTSESFVLLQSAGCHCAEARQPQNYSVSGASLELLWFMMLERMFWQKWIASCKILLPWSPCQHKSIVIYDFQEGVLLCECRNSCLTRQCFPSLPYLLSLCLKGNQGKSKLRDELCHLCRPRGQGQHWSFLRDV